MLLLVYRDALTRNLLFIAVAILDCCLHTSMYFFLKHLSLFDFCFISVTAPKSIINSVSNRREVCFEGCVAQVFLEILFIASELSIHTLVHLVYLATLKGNLLMVAVSTLNQCLHTSMCFFLRLLSFSNLCLISVTVPKSILNGLTDRGEISLLGAVLPHDDVLWLLRHHLPPPCSDLIMDRGVIGKMATASCLSAGLIGAMYSAGRFTLNFCESNSWANAFANCLPYLDVITVFRSTGSVAYLKPVSDSPSTLDLLLSMFYSEVPLP
ncbi:olfactory receptor 14K1-like [Tachyglossus aculeatus]|uniref:olfactory receptor 14K1-like n=1 Tax=Tachyglossus aculeatus TaxID=9261 RepID=UPI0018F2B4DA|nr:olfactory receptor 14K1-like [Tachyglossus aculeatus]